MESIMKMQVLNINIYENELLIFIIETPSS